MSSIPSFVGPSHAPRQGWATIRGLWSVLIATLGGAAILWLFRTPMLRAPGIEGFAEVGEGALFLLLGAAVTVAHARLAGATNGFARARRGTAKHNGALRRVGDINGSGRIFQA